MEYDGQIINEFEREDRYGAGTGPYAIGGDVDNEEDPFVSPIIDCAFMRSVAALANHMQDPEANARYVYDENTDTQWIEAQQDIKSGEEIFNNYGPEYSLEGSFAGKHITQAARRPPPKWFRDAESKDEEESEEER